MSHKSCNMRTRDLLDISALSLEHCAYISGKSLVPMSQLSYVRIYIYIWVIPYQFTKVLHMTLSELDEIRCVGSPGDHMYPKGISSLLLVWLPPKWRIKYSTFLLFCCTCDHSKHHNLGNFHYFEKRFAPL